MLEFVSTVHDLCAVLGLDFLSTITEVHPSLDEANGVQTKSISNETLSRLAKTVLTLKEDKMQRLKKVSRNHGGFTLVNAICVVDFNNESLFSAASRASYSAN